MWIVPLQPAGSVVGMPTGLAPVGVSDMGSLTSCRLVAVQLMSNLTWPAGMGQGYHHIWLSVSLQWVWGFRVGASVLESHGSTSYRLVSPLRFQSAEGGGGGGGGLGLAWLEGVGAKDLWGAASGEEGGEFRQGRVWGVLSRKECMYTPEQCSLERSACTLMRSAL